MSWGRTSTPSFLARNVMLGLFYFSPVVCLVFAVANTKYNGSFEEMYYHFEWDSIYVSHDQFMSALRFVSMWILAQIILALIPDICNKVVPRYVGGRQVGQTTPSGNVLTYNINGLQAWLITIVTFLVGGVYFKWWDPTWVVREWLSLFYAANVFGYGLTLFAYIKAFLFPTYPEDNKYTGYSSYDMIMGVEHNPRIFGFDFKLFFNGRPGIIGWTVLNLCFMYTQWHRYGFVSNSMILVNILQGLYVLDFFWNERWYLNTIDIAHEHFGFYLAWGDLVWLPWMYTLQGMYLVHNPVILNGYVATTIMGLGIIGYVIFRWSNYQRDYFRRMMKLGDPLGTQGKSTFLRNYGRLWGKPMEYMECEYRTTNAQRQKSYLLTSGFWGCARHMNYVGDVLLSGMWCFSCGLTHILPHFYTVYIILLLVTRTFRDETRCQGKYKGYWTDYCKRVPYRFIPYVY